MGSSLGCAGVRVGRRALWALLIANRVIWQTSGLCLKLKRSLRKASELGSLRRARWAATGLDVMALSPASTGLRATECHEFTNTSLLAGGEANPRRVRQWVSARHTCYI
eukprot:scaffold35481_cov112-Isochrysis_galbana.AAC.2